MLIPGIHCLPRKSTLPFTAMSSDLRQSNNQPAVDGVPARIAATSRQKLGFERNLVIYFYV